VEPLHKEDWMRAQTGIRTIPGTPRIRQAKLLLVGSEDEFKGDITFEMMGGTPSYMAERSATLLGALARLHSEAIDMVLLSDKFCDEELALFTADARRGGFHGLILRVASVGAHAPLKDSLPVAPGVHRKNERISGGIYFTDKQRTVLAHVSNGWTNLQIARDMKCTEAAIKAVVQELFRKLQVRKRGQIVRVAIEKGLVTIEGGPAGKVKETREAGLGLTLAPAVKDQQPIHVGDFLIDVAMHQAWVRGVETHLTPSEFQLLLILTTHSGKLVKSSTLREMFWRNPTARAGSLRVLVGALRSKIEAGKTPRYLITERSFGYRLITSPSLSDFDRPPS
jgi:DNA-binding CsgD family transcriptional regulator/DNA-binding winged helix-turn-helix (wHTH) protein